MPLRRFALGRLQPGIAAVDYKTAAQRRTADQHREFHIPAVGEADFGAEFQVPDPHGRLDDIAPLRLAIGAGDAADIDMHRLAHLAHVLLVEIDGEANEFLAVALEFLDASTPSWLRAAQLVLGLAVTGLVVWRRGSWPAALAAGVCARLSVDPATHHYYTAAFALTALIWELDHRPGRLPWRTAVGVIVLELAAADVTLAGFMPYVRLGVLASVIVTALTSPVNEKADQVVPAPLAVPAHSVFSVSSGTGP